MPWTTPASLGVLSASLGWCWADPVARSVLVYYAIREARGAFTPRARGVAAMTSRAGVSYRKTAIGLGR